MVLSVIETDILEKYILNNEIKKENFCLSPKNSIYLNKMYNKILNDDINTYIIIGSSGYRTFSLYKSTNSIIYLFTFYLQEIDNCIIYEV
jgi:hypothetical protein